MSTKPTTPANQIALIGSKRGSNIQLLKIATTTVVADEVITSAATSSILPYRHLRR